jgi:hypothetical protein
MLLAATLLMASAPLCAMKIERVWMTGNSAVDATPITFDLERDGKEEILAVNRRGQVLVWDIEGNPIGKGEDGTIVQLPEGESWMSPPTLVDGNPIVRFLFCSAKGRIAALGPDFNLVWQYSLPGEASFDRSIPTLIENQGTSYCCMGDGTGTVTCLNLDGTLAWSRKVAEGSCDAPICVLPREGNSTPFLIANGSSLFALGPDGKELWHTDLDGVIQSKPELLSLTDRQIIICGTGLGSVYALSSDGKIEWRTEIGDEIDSALAFLPQPSGLPLILCPGLWGNLHAIDFRGHRVWTHLYRAKGRGKPLVCDADHDGHSEIYITTYAHRMCVFDEEGSLKEDMRFSQIINASPILTPHPGSGHSDILVIGYSLLATRLAPGPAVCPYREAGARADIRLAAPSPGEQAVIISNPHGALIEGDLRMVNESGEVFKQGSVSVRSQQEMPLPSILHEGNWKVEATVRDPNGKVLAQERWTEPRPAASSPPSPDEGALRAWATPPYGLFGPERMTPVAAESSSDDPKKIRIANLYIGEGDEGAFIAANPSKEPRTVRITLDKPATGSGTLFGGKITLRENVMVDTVNGEQVPDPLPALQDGGLLSLPPGRSAKVWVCVDAHNAAPGMYRSKVTLAALSGQVTPVALELEIEVLNLEMPAKFPLSVCTWDAANKRWPDHIEEVLDDMTAHGVNVFPRSNAVPKASVDIKGRLSIDWSALDLEMALLKGRGTLLFTMAAPPITFETAVSPESKRKFEVQYLQELHQHMRDAQWKDGDYALYPVDEPGHDEEGKLVEALVSAGRLFREADPTFPIYTDPVWGIPRKDFERSLPFVDIWAPNMRMVAGLLNQDPRMKHLIDSGKPVWAYECIAQVKSVSPLRYNRAYPWRAKFFGLEGMGIWTHSQSSIDEWFPGKGINDEFALVYPGELPVPSLRWEALRDGLEDLAAKALLEQRVDSHRKAGTQADLVREAEEEIRIAENDFMDLSDLGMVESRDFLKKGDRTLPNTWSDAALYERHRARIAELTLALAERRSGNPQGGSALE